MTTEHATEFRRATHVGAARNLERLLRSSGLPPVLEWEITEHGTLRGRLAEDGNATPVEAIRAVRARTGGTVRCRTRENGQRQLLVRYLFASWYVELWTPSPRQ